MIFKRSKSYFSQRYLLARKKISGRTDFLNTVCKIYEADIDSCLSRIKVDNVLVGKILGIKVVSPNKIITAVDFVTFRGNFNWKLIDNAVLCRCLTFARRRKATESSTEKRCNI